MSKKYVELSEIKSILNEFIETLKTKNIIAVNSLDYTKIILDKVNNLPTIDNPEQEFKVGDEVYYIYQYNIEQNEIRRGLLLSTTLRLSTNKIIYSIDTGKSTNYTKDIFKTKEEAEQALKELEE